ncbi:MAG: hypothetical protein HYV65_02320 [Candidatus Spechtbacteria bacterium]|nr:hypothetical protein [Candidatus Spechtbacteria bacterium]
MSKTTKIRLRTTLSFFTSAVTAISMSGVMYLAPVASAATIADGDLIRATGTNDIYIVKLVGAKMFKRLILNPEIFNSYGHLKWSNVQDVTQATVDGYTNSNLVLEINADGSVKDPKVYAVTSAAGSDTGERRHLNVTAAEFESAGLDWDSLYKINSTEASPTFYPTQTALTATDSLSTWATNVLGGTTTTTTPTTPAGTGVSIALDSSTPAAQQVAGGASDFVFAKVKFVGGANTTISSLVVSRAGLAEDNDFTALKLWDGSTQLGGTQALNTTTHKATFTGLNWVVPAGTTKILTITGTLDVLGTNTATTGNTPRLGIAAATDVTATTTVSGTFPVYGNSMTIAGIGVGTLDVTLRTVPADSSPVAGATAVEIASWTFDAETEGMSVRSIKVTQTGSASSTDVKNVMLKADGVQLGSTVPSLMANGSAVFDLSATPYSINAGVSKIIYLYADISAGIVTGTTTRTIDFEITEAADVVAFGANSGGSITITTDTGGDSVTYTTQSGVAQTVGQGTIPTVAVNGATNPSAQAFVNGTTQQLFSAFRFSNGVAQDVRVARIRLNLLGTGAGATDVSNITLYKYDELTGTETQVGTATNFVGTVATYGADAPGLDTGVFDIPKSKNVVLHVRGDVSTSASYTTIEIALNEVRLDGVQSAANMDAMVVTGVDGLGEVRTHNANSAVGTLTIALAPTNPGAKNVVPGTAGHEYGKFNFTANGEAITISTLIFNLQDNAAAAASGDFTNVKLWDGATQIGSTVASPTSSATFSVNVTIAKDATKTFTVTSDVPTNANTAWAGATRVRLLWTTNATDVVATGVSSTASVTATTSDLNGSNMTALVGALTVSMSTNPPATTYVNSTSQAWLGRLVLTAGSAEDLKVSAITFTVDNDGTFDADVASETYFSNVKLYDGTTVVKSLASFTEVSGDDRAAFTGISVDVAKGSQKVLDLKADVIVGGSVVAVVGVDDANATGGSDIVATGLSSNSTVYGASSNNALIAGQVMTLANAGSLTFVRDASTPVAAMTAVGTSGKTNIAFTKFKMTANSEDIDIRTIVVRQEDSGEAIGASDNNFSRVALYDGDTKVSADGYFSSGVVTFTFAEGNTDIAKDANKVWTIKADVLGTSNGATSGDSPELFVGSVVAYGVSSGSLADLTLTENTAASVAALVVDGAGQAADATVTSLVLDNGSGADSGDDDLVGSIITIGTEEQLITAIADGATEDTYTVVRGVNGTTAAVHADNATTQVYSMAIGNAQYLFRTVPTFALCTATCSGGASPSGTLSPVTMTTLRFTITADAGGDVIFDGTNHNLRFTVTGFQGDDDATNQGITVYRQDTGASVGTVTAADNVLDAGETPDVTNMSVTIPAGTTMEFRVETNLADYETDGDSFQLSIANGTADVSWDDDVSTDVLVGLIKGLPITGGAFINPS